jgi:hypothetical protein
MMAVDRRFTDNLLPAARRNPHADIRLRVS